MALLGLVAVHGLLVATLGLSPVAASGGFSSLRCTGFSLCCLSRCRAWALFPPGTWDINSLIKDQTWVTCTRKQILRPWITKDIPVELFFSCFCGKIQWTGKLLSVTINWRKNTWKSLILRSAGRLPSPDCSPPSVCKIRNRKKGKKIFLIVFNVVCWISILYILSQIKHIFN